MASYTYIYYLIMSLFISSSNAEKTEEIDPVRSKLLSCVELSKLRLEKDEVEILFNIDLYRRSCRHYIIKKRWTKRRANFKVCFININVML